jgi:hypothetical protein
VLIRGSNLLRLEGPFEISDFKFEIILCLAAMLLYFAISIRGFAAMPLDVRKSSAFRLLTTDY